MKSGCAPRKTAGGEVVLADVEEDAVARGGRLAGGDRVPDVEACRLDEDDFDSGRFEQPLDRG